jgi:outer membrane protein OmpA-like peptidoglycan-associated protein
MKPKQAGVFAGILFFTLIFGGPSAGAIEFSYKYKTGDKYRIVSSVNEDVYVNRKLGYRAEIVNRISMEITGLYGDRARYSVTFQTAEKTVVVGTPVRNAPRRPFQWSRDYRSVFEQDRFGNMTIDDQYFMPMVRNMPVFPARDLKPGETWTANGTEVHDFRDNFGIEKPYRIPFTANYTYLGERSWKGAVRPAFSISYRIFLEPEPVPGKTFPRRILQASDQIVYWDVNHGQAAAYEEQFRTVIDLSDGQTWEYRGRARAEVIESPPMNKEEMAKEIAGEIKNIPDASVRVSNEGVVISLENIQFDPDSAILRPSERPKLDKIAEILMKYPDRDILVGGHTALAGTPEGRLELSLTRAGTAADYLIGKRVRTPERVVIRGYGAEQPVADNRTEEGMRKNRRVEIVILEN